MKRKHENISVINGHGSNDKVCVISVTDEGGPKNNRNLNVAHEQEVVAPCAARCRESTQYSSSMPRGANLG